MKTSYILLLALLGVSALSLASAHSGKGADSRPPVIIKVNETGIVTLDAVNTALNQTFNRIKRSWSKGNKTTRTPFTMPALTAFLDVDAEWLSAKKGLNVTLLSTDAFQVTATRWTKITFVSYLASTTNGTNVTGIVTVVLPKSSWIKAASEEDEVEAATFKGDDDKKNITKPDWNKDDKNITKPIWDDKKNITKPTKPAKPFTSMVQKIIAANETTATVTVAEINGEANKGIPKIATFGAKANLKTISSAAASKFSWATVSFNAAVSDTSFTVTIPADTKKNTAWVVVAVTGISKTNETTQGTVSVRITRAKATKN
uniref:Uncharacterized protein n=1 Tax=Tetradesmus obliquus TaxID=3088 RepID=A0A383VRL5_TETOB|eukprot:jgi/Sobl393_1/10490/SZX68158.1